MYFELIIIATCEMYVCNATFSKNQMAWYMYMVLLICEHLDILLILNCLLYGPLKILGPPSEVQSLIYVYGYISNCLWSSWELQYSICDMTMKSICFKKCLMFNIRITGEKIRNLSKESFQIYRTWLHKSEFIMAIVALVNDACGHLISCYNVYVMSKSDMDLLI